MTTPMPPASPEGINDRLVRSAAIVVILAVIGWFLYVGRDLLVPIVAAVLCVFAISGLASVLARFAPLRRLPGWGRDLIAASLICFALIELTVLMLGSIGQMVAEAPAYQAAVGDLVRLGAAMLDLDGEQTLQAIRAELAGVLDLSGLLRSVAGSALAALAVLIFVLLNIAFLMMERQDFSAKLDRLGLDKPGLTRVRMIIADVNARVGQYLAVQTLLNIALGIVSWAIMKLFGLNFAVVFAIIIAVLNYIPYFGSFVGVAFPVAAGLVEFASPGTTIWLGVALGLAQFGIGNILAPRVMGTSLNLSPWVILVGLTFWTSIWGIAGAVFSVPIMAVAVVVLSEFDTTRWAAVFISHKGVLPRSGDAETRDKDGHAA